MAVKVEEAYGRVLGNVAILTESLGVMNIICMLTVECQLGTAFLMVTEVAHSLLDSKNQYGRTLA